MCKRNKVGKLVRRMEEFADSGYLERFPTTWNIKIPKAVRAASMLTLLGILCSLLFMFYMPWVQIVFGLGQVTALDPTHRSQTIMALNNGRIGRWHVQEGSSVKSGDPIVEIIDLDPQLIERLNAERTAIENRYNAIRTATQRKRQTSIYSVNNAYLSKAWHRAMLMKMHKSNIRNCYLDNQPQKPS
ncbi:hypothetical protein JYT96_01310 [Gammaproteobacteria bacterium AH-315-C21]|nr:hypothetical protein [Gammaproteobacteria bacterium AH-315-C21]